MTFLQRLLATKTIEQLKKESESTASSGLKKVLTAKDLVFLGVSAVIGAGIFITAGIGAAGASPDVAAGPAVSLSFLSVAIACVFCALCYAEFASMIPTSGSAYSYAYATLGEFVAWILSWGLILEYGVGNMAVAISWAGYLSAFLNGLGIHIPLWLQTATQMATPELQAVAPHFMGVPIVFNLPAMVITGVITWILLYGVKESARFNNALVYLKFIIIAFVIGLGAFYVEPSNWTPFAPTGFKGISVAAALIFFAYVGFDAVSTAAEEAENPSRDVPIGLIGTLLICSLVYIAISLVLTGMVPYHELGTAQPMATAFALKGLNWASTLLSLGALIALTGVLFSFQLGLPRIFFSMARDGLIPQYFAKIHPKYKTPFVTTIWTGVFIAIPSAFLDLSLVIELCNLGTLLAFALVCIGILVLRKTKPDMPRPFRVPCVPLIPILGALCSIFMMVLCSWATWLYFIVYMILGTVIYLCYGLRHSTLLKQKEMEKQNEN